MKQAETQKSEPQTLVRIYAKTKESLKDVIREIEYKEKRSVSEIEIVDPILNRGLKREKKRLGI